MDNVTNTTPPSAPVVPVSENKIKKTFKLFKESWRSFSKAQKFQLAAVFALVLALPTLLGGVYAVKLYKSGAATPPITPPTSPAPRPTPPPTPAPVLKCNTTCTKNANCPLNLRCILQSSSDDGSISGHCRNPSCTDKTNCICSTPTPTKKVQPTPIIRLGR